MLKEYLSAIANAIRSKLGSTAKINAQNFADKIGEVYDAGYNSAVKEGTITIAENTKELKIEGLPKAPKTFNLVAQFASQPKTDDVYLVRGLDYIADGIATSGTVKLLASLWLLTSTNVYNSGFLMGQILSTYNNNENLITFENGTFTIKMSAANKVHYGENFTYRWTATF